ncbi:MAG: ComEC family competence protein [Bacteroidetes bacterium]|nr:ComEC family competence protein [Bacteroidota bacterium]
MIDLRRAPVVRVLIPYACGSLAGYTGFIEVRPLLLVVLCLLLWVTAFLFYRLSRGGMQVFSGCFCLQILTLFFIAGFGIGLIDRPQDPGIPSGDIVVVKGRVEEEPELRNGKLVFSVGLRMAFTGGSIFQDPNVLKTYLPVPSGSPANAPGVGEVWILCGRLVPVKNAGNHGEVDYASILRRKNCWYRFYCDTCGGLNRMVAGDEARIRGPGELRNILSEYWEGSPATVSLLRAVCLGDRSGLSEELRQSYATAGGMHVLAVSGLHVGLIWWVLNQLLFFLLRGRKEIYRVILIALILWSFAYITGFSSSVARAVTMFTFYSLSRMISHRAHSVNAILVSMFILILIHPGRMMDVGFQLSYAAILSIVTLNPVIRGIWRPGNWLIRWIWEATGISLAAQVGTLPLVIFYFHQIPVYALLTNLVVIPLLSCIITIFVVSMPLALAGFGAGASNSLLMIAGGAMNRLVEVIASFPGAVVGGLSFDRFTMLLLMILISLLILFLNRRKRITLFLAVMVLCLLMLWSAGKRNALCKSTETHLSHFYGGRLLTIREGLKLDHYILTDDPETVAYMDRYLSTVWGKRCYEVSVVRMRDVSAGHREQGGISSTVQISQGVWLVGNNRNCFSMQY